MSLSHQATGVSIKGRALVIEGEPGNGKTSLALALIDRGAALIGDDGVRLDVRAGRLFASPPPYTAGLIEVRNLGLLPWPTVSDVPVAMLLRLDPEAPRFIDVAEQAELGGVALPMVRLWPNGAVLALKAELALERFGLT